MTYIQQLDETDCGAACLAMIASHYHLQKSVTSIREIACTDTKGTNLAGMIQAAKTLGFSAHALKGTSDAITPELPVPFIAHVSIKHNEYTLLHYVVVKKISAEKIEIWDPDESKGKYTLSLEEFTALWTGYVIFLSPAKEFKSEKNEKSIFLKFVPLLKPYSKILFMACAASLLLVAFGILSTLYTRYIIDEVVFANAKFTLATLSLGMLAVVISQAIMGAVRKILLTHFAFKIDLNLVFSYFSHVFHLPLKFFDSRKTGEIISRMQDIQKIRQMLSQAVVTVIMDTVMILIVGPVLYATNKTLFAVVLLTVPFSSVILFFFSKLYRRQYKKLMSNASEVQSYLVESVNGAGTIKAMCAEDYVLKGFERHQMRMTESAWKAAHLQVYQEMGTELISQLSTIIIFWVGSYLIIKGNMSIGTLVSFTSLAGYFTKPVERLVNLQSEIQEAFVAAERLGEILELDMEMQEGQPALLHPERIAGDIAFKNVSFRYGSRACIYEDLNFEIYRGEKVAFVGSSGCGKTTLAKLLLKFYAPEKGSILLDGKDMRDMDAFSIRKCVGYVPQDVYLFSGTIAENIALHRPESSLEDIMLAAQKAGASSFIEQLPERYGTILGENGTSLSGGERQRLALARALLGNPSMLILDEATSNLDSVSEHLIQNTIAKMHEESITTIIIAHRLSTVIDCDKIFVMDKGAIVQQGNHAQLMQQEGLYKEMWQGVLV